MIFSDVFARDFVDFFNLETRIFPALKRFNLSLDMSSDGVSFPRRHPLLELFSFRSADYVFVRS